MAGSRYVAGLRHVSDTGTHQVRLLYCLSPSLFLTQVSNLVHTSSSKSRNVPSKYVTSLLLSFLLSYPCENKRL